MTTKKKQRLSHDSRMLILSLLSGCAGILVALLYLWGGDHTPKVQWTLTVFIIGIWLGFSFALRQQVIRPLQTISNLLAALREGDYSIRAKRANPDEALGEVMLEVNALGETLKEQRLGAMEATALLRTVMEEIEVAVFAFDDEDCLRLVNRAGERLLGHPVERLLGRTAEDLGLAECLRGEPSRIMEVVFPGSVGRWDLRRGTFRQGGLPHQLIVLSDLSRALREEERQVWQRLIRVLGHELNNSLAPIKSLAGSMENILNREPRSQDWQQDMQKGLSVISARAESLSNFMGSYTRLARLPQPKFQPLEVEILVKRAISLETRMQIQLMPGRSVTIQGDLDQLEQVLINLLRNAVDAAMETGGGVRIGWHPVGTQIELWIEDDGPGLANPANLFVPFFTTKPGGSGIGLVLSRQIAEAHGGTLTLENRNSGHGCRVRLRLPVNQENNHGDTEPRR